MHKADTVTAETFDLTEEKCNCLRNGPKYRKLKQQVHAKLRQDRTDHLKGICEEIEETGKMNKSKDLFQKVDRLTKKACPKVKVISDQNSGILTENADILERRREYCETLYTSTDDDTYDLEPGPAEPVPTVEEVKKALESTKSRKAAGPDGIPIELLKLGEDSVVEAMHRIIVCIWETGKWPDDWTRSAFVPLYKKGDPSICANYRTISLISHASKILLNVILGRITPKTQFEVAEEQAGFRPQRDMHNHLCSLRILTEKARS